MTDKQRPEFLGDYEFGDNDLDNQYMLAVNYIGQGTFSTNRTGVSTYKQFGHYINFNLAEGLSALTTKRVYLRPMFEELFWLLNGHTNIQPLLDADVHIWDNWANKNGDLGPVYGEQWRNREDTTIIYNRDPYRFEKTEFCKNNGYTLVAGFKNGAVYTRNIDQVQNALDRLRTHPDCRRIIVDAWNPAVIPTDDHPTKQAEIGKQALPACHTLFQFGSAETGETWTIGQLGILNIYTVDGQTYLSGVAIEESEEFLASLPTEDLKSLIDLKYSEKEIGYKRKLSLHLHQRSADFYLGVPFNLASYGAIVALFGAVVGMYPGQLSVSYGDLHIYENHIDALKEQAQNISKSKQAPLLITIGVGPQQKADLKGLTKENIRVIDYKYCQLSVGKVEVAT